MTLADITPTTGWDVAALAVIIAGWVVVMWLLSRND